MRSKFLFSLAAAVALAGILPVQAKDSAAVRVSGAWIRVLPGSLPNAGYAVLHNDSGKTVDLVAADSPAYGRIMLHKSVETGGMSRMLPVKQLAIPAHGQVALAPGGYHLMLMQRVVPVKPGMHVKIRLHFADGSVLEGDFLARPANASGVSD